MDELLAASDVVSLHAPAMTETHHLMNAATFARMKPGAYLINCARGSLVDQVALLAALDAGHLGGAALDVTEPEPLPVGHGLLVHPLVIVTPHMASSTVAGRRRLYQQAIDNALGVLTGGAATLVPGSTRRGGPLAW
jgi:glyoxylate reductase